MSSEPLNVEDFERLAAERLDAGALGYFAGGAQDEVTLADNLAALRRWRLRPRVLVDVSEVSTATSLLGRPLSMPVLVAPVALQRVVHPDGELAAARAAAAVGTFFCLSTFGTASAAEVAAAAPGGTHWLQVYVFRDRGLTDALVDAAIDAGFSALVVTVDAPLAGRRERDVRSGFRLPPSLTVPAIAEATGSGERIDVADLLDRVDGSLTWADVERLAARSPVPVLVKGVLTAEDARLACDHGLAGVVVSNHGGRQLDGVNATIDALPEVVEAIAGRIEVLMDGGIRRGGDVLRALALGARAVLAGRAPLWGLAAGGEAGARRVLELLGEEIARDLALLGCCSPADIGRTHVERR
jgi:isopentenyl diphosphate isomerase/L-lactate dehydrogenase-like FMN-dependent dehydrogenase